ncbi:MAG: hypothetical protein QOH61_682 [Chloroflexota bacterium]|jgi:hypothetical protein|nr:hypothetical protein [Chloroflexota bacterium]
MRDDGRTYFYELHEGEDEVFSDILLAHDAEYDEQEFLELVLEARTAVVDTFQEDTLSEAIAHELEKRHGFIAVDDRQIRAAVSVSGEEGETVLATVDESGKAPGMKVEEEEDFRSLVLDVEPDDSIWGND